MLKSDIKKLEKLANIELTEEEEKVIEKDLSNLLEYMSQLDEINVDNVEEMYSPISNELKTVVHKDDPVLFENTEKIKNEFPEIKNDLLKIPSIHG
ncbi:hypothetical protein OSSY52_04740 [Tepiditoga spiralis]|uniref:Asp/Glu-ADT subunit C n=1 Tax=Tepiditoga spiralis TaxID=2108365 RepID=A0A7G1G696_9BACT|nr:Asp-tRNA(Asn)/Glu-tRNA(Gln) amidotransferase subunit GatC [Tepiditoga spiralis]BBE30333.1 hypothetical protein OSSY52_04740 [Tepiditoga spiralis]